MLRNVPLSEACSSTFRGALWARLHSTSSCGEKEAVALFEGLRDFLRVARAHRPEKSLRALMDPSADALCGAPKWLKSTVERLSEKGSEGGFESGFGRYEEAEMGPKEPSRWSVGPRQGCFQGFSDGLGREILRSWRQRSSAGIMTT